MWIKNIVTTQRDVQSYSVKNLRSVLRKGNVWLNIHICLWFFTSSAGNGSSVEVCMMINNEENANYSENLEISDMIQKDVASFINSELFKH